MNCPDLHEKVMLTHPYGRVGVAFSFQKMFLLRIKLNIQLGTESHDSNLTPHGSMGRVGAKDKNPFVRHCMKCADLLHIKVMFVKLHHM